MDDAQLPGGGLSISDAGLSVADAARRLAEDGPNVLPGGQRRTLLSIVVEAVREPMFLLLLLAAGTLYLVFGDLQEGLTLFGFVLVTLGLTLYQEGKTERAIEALRDLTNPRALVVRDGMPQRIAGRSAGRDVVRVTATGPLSEIGRIGTALGTVVAERSPLQKQTTKLVRNLALLALALSVALVLVHGLLRGDWLQALLAGIALAMAMLPEEYPVV